MIFQCCVGLCLIFFKEKKKLSFPLFFSMRTAEEETGYIKSD